MVQTKILKLMLGLSLTFGQFSVYSMEDNPDYSNHIRKRAAKTIEDDSSAIPNSPPRRPITEECNQATKQHMQTLKRLKSDSTLLSEISQPAKNTTCVHVETKDQLYTLLNSKKSWPCILIDSSLDLDAYDMNAMEYWLKKTEVKFIILDNRDDYDQNSYIDKILLKNTKIINPWYKKRTCLLPKDINKLVWQPFKKVQKDLVDGLFNYPKDWLEAMYEYHLEKVSINLDSDPLLEG